MILFRPPSRADIDAVAKNMREIDRLECRVLGGHEPREALEEGVRHSAWSFAAEVDGEVVCIFGVASEDLLDDAASPWMLGVDGLERCAREIILGTRAYLSRMTEQYETLANAVHADNRNAIRYLKWCGFSFGSAFEVEGETFLPFELKRAPAAHV